MTTHHESSAAEPRWRAFAQFIAQGLSHAEAYRKAGYKAKTVFAASTGAGKLLKKAEVQALVQEAVTLGSQGRILTAQRRRELLSDIARGIIKMTAEGATGPVKISSRRAGWVRRTEALLIQYCQGGHSIANAARTNPP